MVAARLAAGRSGWARARCFVARATSPRSSRTRATSSSWRTARSPCSTQGGAAITTLDGEPVDARRRAHRLVARPRPRRAGTSTSCSRRSTSSPARSRTRCAGAWTSAAARSSARRWAVRRARAQIERVYFVACGTSSHAAMAGRYWVEQLAPRPGGGRDRQRGPLPRSGLRRQRPRRGREPERRDADTHGGHKAPRPRRPLLAVATSRQRHPARADRALYTHAGPEIGVASTKCFTTQLVALLLLAVYLGRRRGTLEAGAARPADAPDETARARCATSSRTPSCATHRQEATRARDMLCSSDEAPASPWRSRARSSSRRSPTSTPRVTRRAR